MLPKENVLPRPADGDEFFASPGIVWTRCSCGTVRRERRRICRPAELSLSFKTRTRLNLRRLVKSSGLPQGIFSQWVFGCDPVTMSSYMRSGVIPGTRAFQINRLERVEVNGDELTIAMKNFLTNPRWRSRQLRLAYEKNV